MGENDWKVGLSHIIDEFSATMHRLLQWLCWFFRRALHITAGVSQCNRGIFSFFKSNNGNTYMVVNVFRFIFWNIFIKWVGILECRENHYFVHNLFSPVNQFFNMSDRNLEMESHCFLAHYKGKWRLIWKKMTQKLYL